MTQKSQDIEFNVLGCKVRYNPEQDDGQVAKQVIELVQTEINALRTTRPGLKDTDVAVLVALKIATEMKQLEEEYKKNVFKLEESLETALQSLAN